MEEQLSPLQSQEDLIIEALVYGIIFTVLLTTGLILFFYSSRRKIIKKEFEKVNLKLTHQKHILQATIATQEEERRRIAQDLHDAISAKLNVISLTTHVLLGHKDLDIQQKEKLSHILHVTTSTLENSRRLAHELLPPILNEFGLKVALEEFLEDVIKSSSLQVSYTIDNLVLENSSEELHLFRIVQELMTNSIKHGKPSKIDITLEKEGDDQFELRFIDNGKGFDTKLISKKSGIGLQNIKSRVAILKCDLHIESMPKKGSSFIIKTKQP